MKDSARKKPLPIGNEDFKEIIEKGYYYVDKTLFIKELLDNGSKVSLFTRPRRFGKTLALSMLRYFFEYSETHENRDLFKGLQIEAAGSVYAGHMCSYPVISLSLKSAKQATFEMAYASILDELAVEFERHSHILFSSRLNDHEKELYNQFLRKQVPPAECYKALKFLSGCLQKVYERQVIVLLDEYDVPLENARFRGFYDSMSDFIRSLFESGLKTNPSLEFAVITGCLRISRESIFTGLNNLDVNSVLSSNYAEYFGFTQAEVDAMLQTYGIEKKEKEIRRWYDGYLFGNTDVYNPWSVVNYVKAAYHDENALPRPYWANTSSNSIVRELVEHADANIRQELERLLEGGFLETPVHEDVTYEEIHASQDNLWNFLFFTGYLKKMKERMQMDSIYISLAIPNAEVRHIYRSTIMEWFNRRVRQENFSPLYEALLDQDTGTVEKVLSEYLMETISFFDYKEDYYHGFVTGMLTKMPGYLVQSNRENGLGRSDILLRSAPYEGRAIIIEIKVAQTYAEMEKAALTALTQIKEKKYGETLKLEGYHMFLNYGIAFYKKMCRVKTE